MQNLAYGLAIAGLWLAWIIYWSVAAATVKATERRESPRSRATYMTMLAAGVALMMWPRGENPLFWRFVPPTTAIQVLAVVIVVAGLLFSVWARLHLGRNWSGTVTLKRDHELIRSGPYRFVRHPIYTGLSLAILGTVLSLGEWRGLIALVLIVASFVRKIAIEEDFLRGIFRDEYEHYRTETAALVPFVY